jgi:elongator complex protein 2
MILDAAWAPQAANPVFATAGRDKSVKLWEKVDDSFACKTTISLENSVTAVSILPSVLDASFFLATGEESGKLSIYQVTVGGLGARQVATVDRLVSPSRAVTQLSWRPSHQKDVRETECRYELAVASEDSSVRVYAISNMLS